MTAKAIPHGFAALAIALPTLGLFFFSVPWEGDERLEPVAMKIARLQNPRGSYLPDALVNAYVLWGNEEGKWDGLLPWQRAELNELEKSRGTSGPSPAEYDHR
jgi:hypothetical protein